MGNNAAPWLLYAESVAGQLLPGRPDTQSGYSIVLWTLSQTAGCEFCESFGVFRVVFGNREVLGKLALKEDEEEDEEERDDRRKMREIMVYLFGVPMPE